MTAAAYRRRSALALPVLTATAVLVACSSSPPPPEPSGPPVSEMKVGLSEWSITTPNRFLAAGEATFVVTNVGAAAHDFVVHGQRGDWRTPVLSPGEQDTLTIETEPGELLTLDCGLPGHHEAGMHGELLVDDEPPTRSGGDDDGP